MIWKQNYSDPCDWIKWTVQQNTEKIRARSKNERLCSTQRCNPVQGSPIAIIGGSGFGFDALLFLSRMIISSSREVWIENIVSYWTLECQLSFVLTYSIRIRSITQDNWKSVQPSIKLKSFRFVNLITMRHNGATLPDIVGDEAWVKFDNQLKSKRACKLPNWFFKDKTIKLGPDDNGMKGLKFFSCELTYN